MEPDFTPKRNPTIIFQQLTTGEKVLFDTLGHRIFKINSIGAQIWSLADGSTKVEAIARKISTETGASQDLVTKDLSAFFDRLAELKLIES